LENAILELEVRDSNGKKASAEATIKVKDMVN
jgi:hypothetical protein